MHTVKKAIIPVAGWGARWLPITKTIEKCMLPIGNRPIIDYVVQDCIAAGITEIIFVVGETSTQLENYYRSNIKLNDYLKRTNNHDKLSLVAPLKGITFHYVVQPSYGKYGTAIPVALAAEYVATDESVVVIMGDDMFYGSESEVKHLIEQTPEGQSGILGAVLAADDKYSGMYGSIEVDEYDNLIRVREHPDVVPQPFIKNVSTYLLNPTFLSAVRRYAESPSASTGEYYIFTPFEELLASGETMKLVRAEGMYLDGGSVQGWLHANRVVLGDI